MFRLLPSGALLLFLAQAVFSSSQQSVSPPYQNLPLGSILERVICSSNPDQSYSLYLPSNYTSDRSWPIVYSFDPAARGKIPVELQKEGAERFGYILAASNNSRNGPWKPEAEAAEAMLNDTQARFSIDPHRIYFAGFSGGARLASQLATLCKCAAGVVLSGAGFANGREPSTDARFVVFSSVGTLDFNYREVIPLQAKLALAGDPHWLRTFDGTHEWAPAIVMTEALAWLRVEAIKSELTPTDDSFLRDQLAESEARADSLVQTQEVLSAFREYSQIVATYEGLLDVRGVRAKLDALGKEKSFRDALKQETADFEEQDRLTAGISAALSTSSSAIAAAAITESSAEEQIRSLRERAAHEKRQRQALVFKRALAGVFIEAMELGSDALDHKNYPLAIRCYRSATEANPQSEWAWENLAVAHANNGTSKEALSALRRARAVAPDTTRFLEWLTREPAFDRYHASPDFRDLQKLNGS